MDFVKEVGGILLFIASQQNDQRLLLQPFYKVRLVDVFFSVTEGEGFEELLRLRDE